MPVHRVEAFATSKGEMYKTYALAAQAEAVEALASLLECPEVSLEEGGADRAKWLLAKKGALALVIAAGEAAAELRRVESLAKNPDGEC
jgi:hypothetical protein